MATLPFLGPAIKHRRQPLTGARLIIVASAVAFAAVPAVGDARPGRRGDQRAGQGHSVEQGAADPGRRAGDDPGTAGPVGPAGPARPAAGAARQSRQSRQIQAETESLQARSARLASEGGWAERARLSGEEATLSAVRRQALGEPGRGAWRVGRPAPPRSRGGRGDDQQPARQPRAGAATSRHARAAGREEHRSADRLAQRAARSGRPAGPDRRGARAAGPRAWPRSARRRPRRARPTSASARRR